MNYITNTQNSPDLIELLKAQRIAYSQSKKFQIIDAVSIIIAISFPIIIIKCPDYQKTITSFGGIWTIIYLFSEVCRKNKTKQGAIIQEQFDTELYKIKWNYVLCQEKETIDKIHSLASKYSGNDLLNWYSTKISNDLPIEIAILLCQRINFSWEITQRQRFVIFLITFAIFYYGIYVFIGLRSNIGIYDFLVLVSSSFSFLMYAVLNVISFKRQIISKNETLKFIDKQFENYSIEKSKLPSYESIRQIQDKIFIERTVPEKVPDWFYRFYKSKNENFMDELVIKIQNKL